MKKYVAYLILAFAVIFVLPSCENETGIDSADNTLTLTLSCNNLGLTRATIDGDDDFNENVISSVAYYFYPTNGIDKDAIVSKYIKLENITDEYTTTIAFSNDDLDNLFPNGATECVVYAIANYDTKDVTETSIEEIKALTIESDFTENQLSFVMDSKGTDVVTLSVDNNRKTLSSNPVSLYRTAAKITLDINRFGPMETPGQVEFNDVVYVPVLNNEEYPIQAFLHNGVNNSVIAPDNGIPEDFEYSYCDYNFNMKDGIELEKPFYSYVSDWSTSDDYEAYITLIVPWGVKDGEEIKDIKEYYYKVPVSYNDKKLLRNTYYKITISVSILGTLDPTATVPLNPSYEIVDWSNDEIETAMSDFRYLMVEKNSYVMNNVNTINIPYWSSHDCQFANIKVTKPDLYNGGGKTIDVTSGYDLDLTTRDGNLYITYNRVLDNVYTSSTFDFAPYTITFRIQHTTESSSYYEDITIIQYPAIYGEYEENWDYKNNYNGTGNDGDNGFTYVNGYQADDNGNYDFFGTVNGLSGNSKSSPNRYIFTVTSVEGTPYIIGDPRDMEITYDGDEAIWYDKGRKITNGVINTTENNEIRYYYGTDVTSSKYDNATNSTGTIYANDAAAEAAERTINMVAPKFMLASGYAVLGYQHEKMKTLENLKKRCASYQEDGYPAGRWRLPTRAEFQLIISQVNKSPIPPLPQIYIAGSEYWCAHGVGEPDDDGTVTMKYVGYDGSGHSTRCVYDLWYWGEHDKLKEPADKNVFTWGDVPRSEKAYAPSINY